MDNNIYKVLEHENDKHRYYKIIDGNNKYFLKEYKEKNVSNIRLLQNEFKFLNYLSNVNVPKIKDINYNDCFIIYDYIDGNTLLNKINVSIYEKILVYKKILIEFKKIHDLGIVHCDIKPSNVFYYNGVVTIIDFDNACYDGEVAKYASLMYCSPEQQKCDKLDKRSDIYSLGLLFYELITNNKMFDNYSIEQLNNKNEMDIKVISDNNSHVITSINYIIRKCTYDDKNKRYGSVDELLGDIDNILFNLGGNINE